MAPMLIIKVTDRRLSLKLRHELWNSRRRSNPLHFSSMEAMVKRMLNSETKPHVKPHLSSRHLSYLGLKLYFCETSQQAHALHTRESLPIMTWQSPLCLRMRTYLRMLQTSLALINSPCDPPCLSLLLHQRAPAVCANNKPIRCLQTCLFV